MKFALSAFTFFITAVLAAAFKNPEIWIFNGTPGDEEHHQFYEENLSSFRKTLIKRYGISKEKLHVFYGAKETGYDGLCSRETVLAELAKIVTHSKAKNAAPVWLIFQGHGNRIPGGAMFNLPGPDISTAEMRRALADFHSQTQLVILATTGCSDPYVKALAGKNRIIMTANSPGDQDNESELPGVLSTVLKDPASDANKDGLLTVTEIFNACFIRVIKIFEHGEYIVSEHPQLDGDGDGKATQRPSKNDALGAEKAALKVSSSSKFD